MSDCSKAIQAGLDKAKAAYEPLTNELATVIANMQAKGVDPRKYYDPQKNEVIDLVALLEELMKQWAEDAEQIVKEGKAGCTEDVEKYLQVMVDLAVAYFTKGLSLILPRHMTHIDVKEILSGKLLGGDNSVFHKLSTQVFDSIGMGRNNDLRRVVKDPVRVISNVRIKKPRITL
jgi:hypothetical protein